MKRSTINILFLFVVSLLTGSQTYAEIPRESIDQKRTLQIATLFSDDTISSEELDSIELALRDFERRNKAWSVKRIKGVLDTSGSSVDAFRKLVEGESKVNYVLGPAGSKFADIVEACEVNKIICFGPSYTGAILQRDDPPVLYSFSGYTSLLGQAKAIANHITEQGLLRVALVSERSPERNIVHDQIASELDVQFLPVVRITKGKDNYRSILRQMPRQVEAVVLNVDDITLGQKFIKVWKEERKERPRLYLIESKDGFGVSSSEFQGLRIFKAQVNPDHSRFSKWKEKFYQEYGREPISLGSSVAYDQTSILLRCIRRYGTEDTSMIRRCISETRGYDGFSGSVSFDSGQVAIQWKFEVKEV